MRRVTIKDLAAHLRLSQAAVSRGLRGDPHFPLGTRQKIQAAAEKLGYRPNSIMSELATLRWQTVGTDSGSVIAYISRNPPGGVGLLEETLILPARNHAESLGYRLEVFNRTEFASAAHLQKVLRSRGITDLILGPVYDKSLITEMDWSKFICIQLTPGHFRLPLHSILEDHFNKVLLTWRKVVSHGYQRVGIVLLDHQIGLIEDTIRLAAVHACQKDLFSHLPALTPFFFQGHDNRGEAFVQWCKINRPDAIIGFSEGHFHVFREAFGYEIPYVALHKTHPAFTAYSGITQVYSPAREGINLLLLCRRTNQWGIPEQRIDHVIEPTWFEGTTLPMKKAA